MSSSPRSVFDAPAFNERLFSPRDDEGTAPAGARDLALVMADGVALHAGFHAAPSARATFVVFHGNGEIVADYDHHASRYLGEVGANLVAVDFRGYGRSAGVPTYRRMIADAVPCVRAVRDLLATVIAGAPLVVLGRSLGGACAAEIAGASPALADAIVMESAGAFPETLIARRGLTPPAHFEPDESRVFDPRPKLARARVPVLVLHGADDEIIPPEEARATFAALSTPDRTLVLVPGRGHNDVMLDDGYWSALRALVDRMTPKAA